MTSRGGREGERRDAFVLLPDRIFTFVSSLSILRRNIGARSPDPCRFLERSNSNQLSLIHFAWVVVMLWNETWCEYGLGQLKIFPYDYAFSSNIEIWSILRHLKGARKRIRDTTRIPLAVVMLWNETCCEYGLCQLKIFPYDYVFLSKLEIWSILRHLKGARKRILDRLGISIYNLDMTPEHGYWVMKIMFYTNQKKLDDSKHVQRTHFHHLGRFLTLSDFLETPSSSELFRSSRLAIHWVWPRNMDIGSWKSCSTLMRKS